MTTVQVWFNPESDYANPKVPFNVIETKYKSFDALMAAIEDDEMIHGTLLHTRKQGRERVVVARRPIAFRGDAVDRCQVSEAEQLA